eukprot:TRINITY_DN7835_c0_g1_i1.p1 TRINITY_DN7835_c0_g1~~TRINITY_DN7835_c0_g1_i1.p1  ORF type:complete len:133 (+),score=12.54 TRINITY_DN7835_c0_g1_i1:106-504(+)
MSVLLKSVLLALFIVAVLMANFTISSGRRSNPGNGNDCSKASKARPVRECEILLEVANAFVFNNISALKDLNRTIDDSHRPIPSSIKIRLRRQIELLYNISMFEASNPLFSTAEEGWKLHHQDHPKNEGGTT